MWGLWTNAQKRDGEGEMCGLWGKIAWHVQRPVEGRQNSGSGVEMRGLSNSREDNAS